MRDIVILGSNGMLGQAAANYFGAQGYRVLPVNTRFTPENKSVFIAEIREFPYAIVVNCIGKIKQNTSDEQELLWANSILPLELANKLLPTQTLIHPSTDCVFDGTMGQPYPANFQPNAEDIYGWSKRLGEVALNGRKNTLIIRVSIIGMDNRKDARGLLSWYFSNKNGSKINGFTNHLWNGITATEWCKLAEREIVSISENTFCRLVQAGTKEHYSKYDMLLLFNDIFNKKYAVTPHKTQQAVDRRMQPVVVCKPLAEQILEMKQGYKLV